MSGAASAASYFTGNLNSAQEVPANASTATGFGRVTLNDTETQITVSLNFSGLSSNQTASHIHGAAPPGANAGILFNIGSTGATSGTFNDLFFNVTSVQAAQLKTGQFYFNVHSTNFPGGEIRGQILRRTSTTLDFDGDSKTDCAVTRAAGTSVNWYISKSAGGTFSTQFGSTTDIFMAGDFDGDGRDDITAWRPGADAFFYIIQSGTNTFRAEQFGQTGDDPRMINDYDGDGKTDVAVWRDGIFYILQSTNNQVAYIYFGTNGDTPVASTYVQ